MISPSLQPSPSSETSAFNKIRAFNNRFAGLLPCEQFLRAGLLIFAQPDDIFLYPNIPFRHGRPPARESCGNGITTKADPQNTIALNDANQISDSGYAKIPTARDAPSAIVISEMSAWSIISSFARAVKGKVSDGENAVALVNAKKR